MTAKHLGSVMACAVLAFVGAGSCKSEGGDANAAGGASTATSTTGANSAMGVVAKAAPPAAASPSAQVANTGPSACALISEADVSALLGVPVGRQGFNPAGGAGSICNGNFTATDNRGQPMQVLMVQDYTDLDLFVHPEKLHLNTFAPVQETPSDLGAEAKLFLAKRDPDTSIKSLMLRKNDKLVILQTFFKVRPNPPQLTKDQVLSLGKIVAARM